MSDSSSRLDRIETKIDKLTETIATIARIEEKMVANNMQIAAVERRLEMKTAQFDDLALNVSAMSINNSKVIDHEKRLQSVEAATTKNTVLASGGERVFWLLLAAGVGLVTYFIKGG